jgi:5,10-methylenetetrahydromethanopterin reductase
VHTACAYSAEALRYAVDQFAAGAERAGRETDRLDLGDSLLGAIAPDPDVARRAGRILAAFYIPSMPPALLERHGIDAAEVAPVGEAFAAGDIARALGATPDAVADRIMVAGTPEDWVEWLTGDYASAGLNHALISFTDPFTLKAWANLEVAGLPGLVDQVRLFGEQVLPHLP